MITYPTSIITSENMRHLERPRALAMALLVGAAMMNPTALATNISDTSAYPMW